MKKRKFPSALEEYAFLQEEENLDEVELQRWLLKKLALFNGDIIRKRNYDGFIAISKILKRTSFYIEFTDSKSTLSFDDKEGNKKVVSFPRFALLFKEKHGECSMEIDLDEVFNSLLGTHRVLIA